MRTRVLLSLSVLAMVLLVAGILVIESDQEDVEATNDTVYPSITSGNSSLISSGPTYRTYNISPNSGYLVPMKSSFYYDTSNTDVTVTYTPSKNYNSATVTVSWTNTAVDHTVYFYITCIRNWCSVSTSVYHGTYELTSFSAYSKTYTITPDSGYRVPDVGGFSYSRSSSYVSVSYSPAVDKKSATVSISWSYSSYYSASFTVTCNMGQCTVSPSVTHGSYSLYSTTISSKTYYVSSTSEYTLPSESSFTYTASSPNVTVTYERNSSKTYGYVTISWTVAGDYTASFNLNCIVNRCNVSPTASNGSCSLNTYSSYSKSYYVSSYSNYVLPSESSFTYTASSPNVTVTYKPSSTRTSGYVTISWETEGDYTVSFNLTCLYNRCTVSPSISHGTYSNQSTTFSKTYTITPSSGYRMSSDTTIGYTKSSDKVTVEYSLKENRTSGTVTITWSEPGDYTVSFSISCVTDKCPVNTTVKYGTCVFKSATDYTKTYTITPNSGYLVPVNFSYTRSNSSVTVEYEPDKDNKSATVTVSWPSSSTYSASFTVNCIKDPFTTVANVDYGTYRITDITSTSKIYTITPDADHKVPAPSEMTYTATNATVDYSPSSDKSSATLTVTKGSSYYSTPNVSFDITCTIGSCTLQWNLSSTDYSLSEITENSKTYNITAYSRYLLPTVSEFKYTLGDDDISITYTPSNDLNKATMVVEWSTSDTHTATVYINGKYNPCVVNGIVSNGTYVLTKETNNSRTYVITADNGWFVPISSGVSYSRDGDGGYGVNIIYEPSSNLKTAEITVKWTSSGGNAIFRVTCSSYKQEDPISNGTCDMKSCSNYTRVYKITADNGYYMPKNIEFNNLPSGVKGEYAPDKDGKSATVTFVSTDYSSTSSISDYRSFFSITCEKDSGIAGKMDGAMKANVLIAIFGIAILGLILVGTRW